MSKIHSGQGVKANWGVAMQDGKVTPEEGQKIVDAAKRLGVSNDELLEARGVLADSTSGLVYTDFAYNVLANTLSKKVDGGEPITAQDRERFLELREVRQRDLATAQQAIHIKEELSAARDGQWAAHSIALDMGNALADFGRWSVSMFGGDD